MWGEIFSFQYVDLNSKLRSFFSLMQSHSFVNTSLHIPLVGEFQRKRCKRRYTGSTVGLVFYRIAYSSFSQKSSSPVTKNESKEFMRIEGLADTRSMSTQTHGKGAEERECNYFHSSLHVPDIGKNKRGIGKSARRHHPKCFKLLFGTFINHQKFAMLNTVFGRYQSKAHFLTNEQGKKAPTLASLFLLILLSGKILL